MAMSVKSLCSDGGHSELEDSEWAATASAKTSWSVSKNMNFKQVQERTNHSKVVVHHIWPRGASCYAGALSSPGPPGSSPTEETVGR